MMSPANSDRERQSLSDQKSVVRSELRLDENHDEVDPTSYASAVHKGVSVALTLLLHCGVAAGLLALQNHGFSTYGGGIGILFLAFCGLHLAFLLSFAGPGHPGCILCFGVGYWVPSQVHDPLGCFALNLIGLVHFFGVAVVELQDHTKPCGEDDSLVCDWSVIDRLYYSIVLMTTVGYGNKFIPQSAASRYFTLTFALYAFILFGATTFALGNAVSLLTKSLLTPLGRLLGAGSQSSFTPPPGYDSLKGLYLNFVTFVVLNFFSAAVFAQLEDGWTFSDGLYFCTITASTIGLGDIAPHSQGGRAFAMFHMLVSVGLFATVIGTILSALEQRKFQQNKAETLSKQLDVDLITSLDIDGDGVDKAEFVLGMLSMLGVLKPDDYVPFLEQFERFDTTGDGKLTREDLEKLALANRAELENEEKSHRKLEQTNGLQALRASAARLLLPTGIMCLSFVWNTIFGYMLLGAGLVSGLGIGIALGSPPSARVHLWVSAGLAVVASLALIFAIVCITSYMIDPAVYLDFDKLMEKSTFSTLDEDNNLVPLDAGMKDSLYSHLRAACEQADLRFVMGLYSTFFALSAIGQWRFAYLCICMSSMPRATKTPGKLAWSS